MICVVSMKDSRASAFVQQIMSIAPPVVQQMYQEFLKNDCDDTVFVHPVSRARLNIDQDFHRVGMMIDQVALYGTPILIIGGEGTSVSSVRNGRLDRCVTPFVNGDYQLQ